MAGVIHEAVEQLEEAKPRRFKPYPKYKDSGVEWLGEIPQGWEAIPVKRSIGFTTGWTPPTGADSNYAGDNLWANIGDLGARVIRSTANTISDKAVTDSGLQQSPVGSLLFSFKLSVGAVSIVGIPMYTNEAIATFLPNESLRVEFLYWSAPLFVPKNAAENIYGAQLLSRDRIANAIICKPPADEQHAIASFLDRETAKIDALVAKKERLIELLQEKRTALITRAVTKGLDPNAPMKDSGVEWLGDIPEHWEAKRIRDVARELQTGPFGSQLHADEYVQNHIPVINPANLSNGLLVADAECTIPEDIAERLTRHRVQQGDILFARRGELGRCGLVEREQIGWMVVWHRLPETHTGFSVD